MYVNDPESSVHEDGVDDAATSVTIDGVVSQKALLESVATTGGALWPEKARYATSTSLHARSTD